MTSRFAQQFREWQHDHALLLDAGVADIMDLGDARKAVWAWAVALIAGGYETEGRGVDSRRTWDNYFQNLGVK